ncbi:tetratricopeptide repeat protein [Psychrobacillus sp. L3]|uniref:tetratricopeptide repeat protein n=1 Tax=Psychrobacillus sp. L3 TaxID=3236891 RepID=UPI0036F2092F
MNYFSKKLMGGPINSAGISQQDCASIIFLFKYLEDIDFEEISFETNDDFTIRFKERKEIYVQVKINQINTGFARNLLKDHQVNKNRKSVFVGSGFDDEFRNLWSKFVRYEKAMTSNSAEKEKISEEFQQECIKKKIPFDKMKNVKFYIIEKLNSINLAKNAIYDWADKKRIFVDVDRVLELLISAIVLDLRENGGSLNKRDVSSLIDKCRQSKISSCNNGEELEEEKRYIIDYIENQMLSAPLIFDKLQILKHEIEMGLYVEAINHIEEIKGYCNMEDVYIWLLLMNGKYTEIIAQFDNLEFKNVHEGYILGEAYLRNNDIKRAIKVFEIIKHQGDDAKVNYKLFKCHKANGDIEYAKQALNNCIKEGMKNEFVYYELGNLHSLSPECIEYYDKSLRCNSKFVEAYLEKGKYLRYKGAFEDAINCFEKYFDLSKEYTNTTILFEIAMCYYRAKKEEQKLYISRWVARLIHFDNFQRLNIDEHILIIDIGYSYNNKILIKKSFDGIEVDINGEIQIKLSNIIAQTGIGLFVSPFIYDLLKISSQDDEKKLIEKAVMPSLFKISDDMSGYVTIKEEILSQKVLHLNHDYEDYKEYIVKDEDIKVNIFKKLDGLDAIVQIGDYIADILIPSTNDGFQQFRKKVQNGTMLNEAAFMLIGPSEILQITFDFRVIKIHDI